MKPTNHLRPTPRSTRTPVTIDSLPLLARPSSGRVFSRRTLLGTALGLGVVAVTGYSVTAGPSVGTARTTSDLNLRSRSNTSSKVLLVIPSGATVTLNGREENGFQDVTYNGTPGWASSAYLTTNGGSSGSGNGGSPGAGTAKVHSALNLRSGPSTGHAVLRVMPGGATVQMLGQSQNGFQYIQYQGQAGWAFGDFLLVNGAPIGHGDGGQPPASMTTTTSLNLRSGNSLQDKVLVVMPAGAKVTPVGPTGNGFIKVTYKGTTGWAWGEYLK